MPFDVIAAVTDQRELGPDTWLLALDAPQIAAAARAGEFVMLGLPEIDRMLIRRPFSIARVGPAEGGAPRTIEIVYKVFGSRTAMFSTLRPGAKMSVLGPLGRGFWLPEPDGPRELLLVAGGIGIAIFPLLVQQLGARAGEASLLYGARTAAELVLRDWFAERGVAVELATDDGSAGHHGMVTDLLEARLARPARGTRLVMACGPTPMLRAVGDLAMAREVPCQLALEETMACGFGVCLGCVVPRRNPEGEFDRFVRVCTEGPVFDAREVAP
ncbi:MAG: dihydroorotate dehydrogenase electron transfer subunit [Acidobacteriota bacterium]